MMYEATYHRLGHELELKTKRVLLGDQKIRTIVIVEIIRYPNNASFSLIEMFVKGSEE